MALRLVTTLDKIPHTAHYGIFLQDSYRTAGDERSRTHPGHGYPAETVYHLAYEVYTDRMEWLDRIKELVNDRKQYRAVEVKPVKIEQRLEIKVAD